MPVRAISNRFSFRRMGEMLGQKSLRLLALPASRSLQAASGESKLADLKGSDALRSSERGGA
jgi:hypothetical protein